MPRSPILAFLLATPVLLLAQVPGLYPESIRPCLPGNAPEGYGTLSVFRALRFEQFPGGEPHQEPELPGVVHHGVVPPAGWAFSNLTLAGPGLPPTPLSAIPDSDRSESTLRAWGATDLERQAPAGSWMLQFQVHPTAATPFAGFLLFNTSHRTPPVPRLLDLPDARRVDPVKPFVVRWEPWTAMAPGDQIRLFLGDDAGNEVFTAAIGCDSQASPSPFPSAFEIPAGRLQPGRRYHADLGFHTSILRQTDDASRLVQTGYDARITRFTVVTLPPSAPESAAVTEVMLQGSRISFRARGEPGANYRVESSADLVTWSFERTITLPPSGSQPVFLIQPADRPERFFRVIRDIGIPEPTRLDISRASPGRVRVVVRGTPGSHCFLETSADGRAWSNLVAEGLYLPRVNPGFQPPPGTTNGQLALEFLAPPDRKTTLYRVVAWPGSD